MKAKRFLAFSLAAAAIFIPLTAAAYGAAEIFHTEQMSTDDIRIKTANAIVENFYIGNKISQISVRPADPEKYTLTYRFKDEYPSADHVMQPGEG